MLAKISIWDLSFDPKVVANQPINKMLLAHIRAYDEARSRRLTTGVAHADDLQDKAGNRR